MARTRTPSYTVGYKRPPVHTRFQRGQSGNPGGRPRRTPEPDPPSDLAGEDAQLLRIMREEVGVNIDGQSRRITRREALERVLIEQAMAGDLRALKLVLEREARASAIEARAEADSERLAEPLRTISNLILEAAREGRWPQPDEAAVGGDPAPCQADAGPDVALPGTAARHREASPLSAKKQPQPAPGDAMRWGNAADQPVPPRRKTQRRAISSEPLIKSIQPLTGRA